MGLTRPAGFSSIPPMNYRRLARILTPIGLIAGLPLGLIVGCQSKLIYFPRPYPPGLVEQWRKETQGRTIDFQTSQGSQQAFLQGRLKEPRNLWIVCGGNGTVALDWSDWLSRHAPPEDAWLLVDFPGYGASSGSPNPERIRESFRKVVPLAVREIGWPSPPDPEHLRFFGHSLGAAACLIAATEFRIQRGVLVSPFTSTMEMGRELTGLPIGFLVTHRYDNSARLAELAARGPGEVIILHGTDDEIIPVSMSRRLAGQQQKTVRLREIPGGRHNTIPQLQAEDIAEALDLIGGPNP